MNMGKKSNFFLDNEDISFHLKRRVDFAQLFALIPHDEKSGAGYKDADDFWNTWLGTLEALGEASGSVFSANSRAVEGEDLTLSPEGEVIFGPAMQSNREMLTQLGISALGIEYRFGGVGGPFVMQVAVGELISRGCPSTYLSAVWYGPIAEVINTFGSEDQRKRFIPKIAAAEMSGSMALTEPDAGSDLGALRTFGEQQADGSWRLFGTKRFISNGNAEISLVLAQGKRGVSGLSSLNLYLVERVLDGVQNFKITKLEEKIGLHGSPTCELKFDGSRAELIGEEGQGFRYMTLLMNTARIAVGFQGLGMMEAIFRMANNYAQDRKAWGKSISRHELIAEKLLDMEVDLKAFRSLCYQAANSLTIVQWGESKLKESALMPPAEVKKLKALVTLHQRRTRNWTPLIKWWSGEKTQEHARTAMQILGGYGFTTEYRAEWWLRESLILPIYEGTSQIQALMCTKDTLKAVIKRPARFLEMALGQRVLGLAQVGSMRRKLARMKQLYTSSVMALIFRLIRTNVKNSFSEVRPSDLRKLLRIFAKDLVRFENISPALLHSERICEMKAILAMATSVVSDAEQDPSREWIAQRFLNKGLPQMMKLKTEIEMDEPTIADRLRAYAVKGTIKASAKESSQNHGSVN